MKQKEISSLKGRGCGARLVWSELPRMDRKELEKLLEVKNLDDIVQLVTKNKDFKKAFSKEVKKVDKRFITGKKNKENK